MPEYLYTNTIYDYYDYYDDVYNEKANQDIDEISSNHLLKELRNVSDKNEDRNNILVPQKPEIKNSIGERQDLQDTVGFIRNTLVSFLIRCVIHNIELVYTKSLEKNGLIIFTPIFRGRD